MRCPECNKFTPQEVQEPEVDSLEIDESGHVSAQARLVIACAECSTELKEATFDLDADVELDPDPDPEAGDLDVELQSAEATERREGKGKIFKTYRGVRVEAMITRGGKHVMAVELSDEIQASAMDSLI